MRVLLLINSLYTGGAEFSSLSFHGWLLKKGYHVKLVALKKVTPSYDSSAFGFNDVQVLHGGTVHRYRMLKSIIKDFKPAIVHSVLFDANLLGRLCRIFVGGFKHMESLVNEMYSESRYADPQVTRFKLTGYRLLDWITQIRGVDHYHANGHSVAEHYQLKLGISKNRITIVPRGRESNVFVNETTNREKVREEWEAGEKIMLINIGRHEYQKGQEILINALAILSEPERKQILVLIVGREGKLTPLLKEKITASGLEQVVKMTGHRNDINSLLAAADLFVFTSRFEGLPGALIEAEAAGLPLICSDIPNNHEVANAENSIFYQTEEANALVTAIRSLLNQEDKRAAMGVSSLQIFNGRFQIEKIHQQMEQLLITIANQKD